MRTDDRSYFIRRAAEERAAAEKAASPEVAEAHREMAERYTALVAAQLGEQAGEARSVSA
jgi:hypothetical protein